VRNSSSNIFEVCDIKKKRRHRTSYQSMSVVLPLMYAGNVAGNEYANVYGSLAQHSQFIENAKIVFIYARKEHKESFDAQLKNFQSAVSQARIQIRPGIDPEQVSTMVAAKNRMADFIKANHLYICSQLELGKADDDTRQKYESMKQFLGLQYLECKRPCVIL